MKKYQIIATLSSVGLALATQANAVVFNFQENNKPNQSLGIAPTFTEGAYTITASGFDTSGNPSELFSKVPSPVDLTETGLGMVTDLSTTDHEIDVNHFIQLDLRGLVPTTACSITISSIQPGEGAVVLASKNPGSISSVMTIANMSADGTVDVTSFVNAGYFIDITASGGNVLITTLTACETSCSLTAPNPLPACGSGNNTLSGPAGMSGYAWSIISSTAPGWAITGPTDGQTVTYTAGASGEATFQLVVSSADGCSGMCQVTFGCAASAGGCRVTGGSNKQLNTFQSRCVLTTAPNFVSHGGQVGASHAGETEFTPYSACISGEWEHDRHLTQNSLVGVLHASGNGNVHQFDSLLCACLPCDDSPSAVGLVGDVCNPNNRNCGPLPSKAPANKICFSGVGDYTDTKGQKTIKAVFRVDIEDRSEGNSPASAPPPDRYRIRIWLLGTDCRPFGPDSADGLALRFAVSADAALIGSLATTENLRNPVVAGPPDIDDGGDMTQGNHQIHPETGSTCP